MLDTGNLVADGGRNAELFFQFTAQGVARLLALFNFSAGKFPLQRHRLVPRALAHQQLSLLHNEPCDHALHFSAASSFFPTSMAQCCTNV